MMLNLITLGAVMVPFLIFLEQGIATHLGGDSMVPAGEHRQAWRKVSINGGPVVHLDCQQDPIQSHQLQEEKRPVSQPPKGRLAWQTRRRSGQKAASSLRPPMKIMLGAGSAADSRVDRIWLLRGSRPLLRSPKERAIGAALLDPDQSREGVHRVSAPRWLLHYKLTSLQ